MGFYSNIRDKLSPEISPDNFPDVNLEDMPLYETDQDDTTDAEGGLSGKTQYDEEPTMATGLYHEVSTPEVNDNSVNTSVILLRGNSYA